MFGNRNRQASNSDTSTTAVSTRCLSTDRAAPPAAFGLAGIPIGVTQRIGRHRFAGELLAGSTEAAFAVAIGIDRRFQRLRVEVGPEFVGKIELRLGHLPTHQIPK